MNTWDPRIPLPNGIEKCICWHLVLDTRPRVVPSQLMHSWWKMRSHHYREIIDAPGMLRMGLQLPSLARDLLEFIANSVVTACENVMPLTRMDFRVEWWLIRNRVLPVIRKPRKMPYFVKNMKQQTELQTLLWIQTGRIHQFVPWRNVQHEKLAKPSCCFWNKDTTLITQTKSEWRLSSMQHHTRKKNQRDLCENWYDRAKNWRP